MQDRGENSDWPVMELVAVVVFTILIAYSLYHFNAPPTGGVQTSYIVPSQTVRW